MQKKSFLLCLLVCLFILCVTACKSDLAEQNKDYKFYNLQKQGWKSKRINQFFNDINYTVTEVPLQYYILKNNTNAPQVVDSIYELNKRERIVEIEFQHSNKKDLLLKDFTNKSYEDAVKYMSFSIEKDFTVVTSSNDTIKCSGVHFERNFKVAPFKCVLLYFNNINPDDNIKLIYQDRLFGNGKLTFNFNETPIAL